MKYCPQCRRTYNDDSQFCFEDGLTLLFADSIPNQSFSGDTPTIFVPKHQTPTSFSPPIMTPQNTPVQSTNTWIYPVLGLLLGVIVTLGFLAFYPRNLNEKANTASIKENKNEIPKVTETQTQKPPEAVSQPVIQQQSPPVSHFGRFPEGSTRFLNENDIYGKSAWDLRVMRNEIFARHGYIFKKTELRNYFMSQSWYSPRYSDVSHFLSAIEKRNVIFLKSYE